ncbi:MAG: Na+/H+ antiporter subunit E [Balneolaceae bacterium]|nr:Na+/H+ antiporter subunit E [Balneolaceae bacterium]
MNKLSFFSLTMSFLSLMTFWVIMSGFFDFIHLGLGVLTVAGVMYVNYQLKTHRFFDDDMDDLSEVRFGRAVYYVFWMIIQIVIAGFHVVGIIIRRKMPIHTTMITFRTNLPSAHARMILGNSISLTPGTLTIEIEGDMFIVHAIDDKSFEGISSDKMPREVLKLFQKEERQVIEDLQIITQTKKAKNS